MRGIMACCKKLPGDRARVWAAGTLLFLLALGLRLRGLGAESVWMDDFFSAARLDAPNLLRFLRDQRGDNWEMVPVYYTLEYFWALLRPGSLAWVRGLSVLFGAGAVVLVFSLGRRLGGMVAGCVAGAVMALSPWQIFHSQGLRPYALMLFLSLVSMDALLRWTESRRAAPLAAHLAANLLMLWSHLFAPLFFLPQGLVVLFSRGVSWRGRLFWGGAHALFLLAVLGYVATIKPAPDPPVTPPGWGNPWAVVTGRGFFAADNTLTGGVLSADGENLRWAEYHSPTVLRDPAHPLAADLLPLRPAVELALARCYLLTLGLMLFFAARDALRRGEADRKDLRNTLVLLAWFLVPVAALFLVAQFWKPHAFQRRYVFYAWPALCLLVGLSAARLRGPARWAHAAAPLAMLAVLAAAAAALPMRHDYLSAAGLLREHAATHPAAMTDNWNLMRILRCNDPGLPVPVERYLSPEETAARAVETVRAGTGVWVLFVGPESLPQRQALEQTLRDNDIPWERVILPGMQSLYLYRCDPAEPALVMASSPG